MAFSLQNQGKLALDHQFTKISYQFLGKLLKIIVTVHYQ
jgi:hypothetical protein